jgi:GT2 family glycosyltransferase
VLSLIVVNWNAGEFLLRCLRSFELHQPSVSWEAIVIDNASTDGSAERAQQEFPWVRVIQNGENRGLPAANNQGMLASRGEFLLISNPDVEYRDGAVDALLDVLTRKDRAAFAVPRLLYEDGQIQASAGARPTLSGVLLGRQLSRVIGRGRASGLWWESWSHDVEQKVGRGSEAAYLVRRAALSEIGAQDERFVLDWEGPDWADRAARAGWEVWFTPAADVVHHGGVSIRQVQLAWVTKSHRGMYRYFAKRSPWFARPLLALVFAARGTLKGIAVLVGPDQYERAHRSERWKAEGS